jgi:glycolate oxidase FAD binding subunit
MALSDGTTARSGGKVIKNVAGYDLAKLFGGSLGTLGVICELAVRLHPRPPEPITARASCGDPERLGTGAAAVAHSPLEAECLDAAWAEGGGEVLARFAGAAAADHAEAALGILAESGLEPSPAETGDEAWERQRAGQRSAGGIVLRVAGVQSDLPALAELAEGAGASLVARAGLGIYWLKLEGLSDVDAAEAARELRARLAPRPAVVLDAPAAVRRELDVWDEHDPGRLALARRLKQRFDPTSTLNPGIFVGGI